MRVSKRVFMTACALFSALITSSLFAATYVVPTDRTLVDRANAIVVARALTSYVEESKEHGIETVTVLSVEESLKGRLKPGDDVKVRVIGGVTEKQIKLIYDAPKFDDGERVLVFLSRISATDYAVTDFGLGLFNYATDETGRTLLVRSKAEIRGWDLNGSVHHEKIRDADGFGNFIRGVAQSLPVADNYMVEPRPLMADPARSGSAPKLPVTTMTTFTVTQYTMPSTNETSAGFRWKGFPAAVNWNKGSNETGGAPNGGTDGVNAAFASWNNAPSSNVNYVLASTTANTLGVYEAADGVNNIVFEKNMTGNGINLFTCASGGVVGVGGIQTGVADGTNVVNGETFFRTTEGDVSYNAGVGPCIGAIPGIPVGDFNSGLTHEFGHTLGFRHADKSRDNSVACTTMTGYDCASSAIMTATITPGLNGALQAWEQRAVAALYPSAVSYNPPTSVEAHATSTTQALVSWIAPGSGTAPGRYNVYRSANPDYTAFSFRGFTATTSFTDTVTNGAAYLYKVRSADAGNTTESADSNRDLATIVIYTNPTLTVGSSTVQGVDLNELQTAVNAVRTLYGIGTNPVNPVVGTPIHAQDINDMRVNLNTAITGMGFPSPTYSHPGTITVGMLVTAADFAELRTAMR